MPCLAYRDSRAFNTSPGSGRRPVCFFEKIVRPPAATSKTPPDDGIRRSVLTSFFLAFRISSATRTAWERYPHSVQYSIVTSIASAIDHNTPNDELLHTALMSPLYHIAEPGGRTADGCDA